VNKIKIGFNVENLYYAGVYEMAKKGEITAFEIQKTNKPKIEAVAGQLMDGDFKTEFMEFLDFLKQEKIRCQWGSTNSFNANYKNKRVARILIAGGSGFIQNHWRIIVATTDRDKFDSYLEGQTTEIRDMFMEKINKKCTKCGICAPGKTFDILGERYENICFDGIGTLGFRYTNPDFEQTEVIKRSITARKEYIIKMLAMGLNPGGL
jgi:hypothetical protein